MRAYTQDEIMADAMPCKEWDRERVADWYQQHGLTTATAIDILTSERVDDTDAVFQACRMIDGEMRQEFGRIMAEIAIDTALSCYETWERYDEGGAWYRWARRWLSGEDRTEAAAESAAWAVESPAWSAAAAARSAWSAWSAKWSAAWAARSSAESAESAAARSANREILLALCEEVAS